MLLCGDEEGKEGMKAPGERNSPPRAGGSAQQGAQSPKQVTPAPFARLVPPKVSASYQGQFLKEPNAAQVRCEEIIYRRLSQLRRAHCNHLFARDFGFSPKAAARVPRLALGCEGSEAWPGLVGESPRPQGAPGADLCPILTN